ncbi:MAG: LysR family transcriptional regulator [Azospirillaceae bacterium]
MDTQAAMRAFVEVARAGGFTEAARRLGVSTSAVSRHVAELERLLGVALLRRTTRHVAPTEAGARYLARAGSILDEIAALHAEIAEQESTPRGRLKITAPPAIGRDLIAPLAIDFAEAHPEIALELDLTERLVDLVGEGYDAAIRSGPLADSALIAHRLVEMPYVVCASPAYLARRGCPATPGEIAGHDCLHWRGSLDGAVWRFTRNGETVAVPIHGRLLVSDLAAERAAALRGLGLALMPAMIVRDDLAAGRLVAILSEYETYRGLLSLVRPPTRFEPARLRAFIDFATRALRARAGEGRVV